MVSPFSSKTWPGFISRPRFLIWILMVGALTGEAMLMEQGQVYPARDAYLPNPSAIIQIMTFVTIPFVTLVTGILRREC